MALGFGVALLQLTAAAQNKPALPNAATNAPKLSPEEQKHNMSYAIGTDIGNNLKRGGVDLDMEVLTSAMKDAMAGKPPATDGPAGAGSHQQLPDGRTRQGGGDAATRRRKRTRRKAKRSWPRTRRSPDIKTLEVKLPDGTTAEMQYKVITEGTGAIPKSNDMVTVNYRGTLINGKEFDSSAKAGGQPRKFPVNRVVRGWTEALEHMKAGSKWELYLPSSLAYGDNGYGPNIEPGSTLIFEMELTGIEAPPAPSAPATPPAPLTSDIIKVPSAEELKKGAKIEVIKAEDLEKMTNAAAQKAEKK